MTMSFMVQYVISLSPMTDGPSSYTSHTLHDITVFVHPCQFFLHLFFMVIFVDMFLENHAGAIRSEYEE